VVSAHSASKPWWQQATALVTVTTGGVITGFSFVPGAAATLTSPTSMPLHLLALQKAASGAADSSGAALRSAIVNVAKYYLRLAQTNTPAQMEALIWSKDSLDGADHGPTCAAFASLTLELGAQAVGEQSWVTGGTTYPWPLHEWADVRVDPNPDSLDITSILQDAQAHGRWHPLGDGYQPQPGDWVLFNGHVEVVTGYANGVLDSIGADSLPNLTVNAHSFNAPLAEQGVVGFVDNGHLASSQPTASRPAGAGQSGQGKRNSTGQRTQSPHAGRVQAAVATVQALADIPGADSGSPSRVPAQAVQDGTARGAAAIPGAVATQGQVKSAPRRASAPSAKPRKQNAAQASTGAPETQAQQAFINEVAPGAMASEQRYGVPASVTIAQAIDESDWGQSSLAAQYNNLFGIKGTGPAGTVALPTQEYYNGQWVTITADFRVYYNVSQSIADHAQLLATDSVYQQAMADRAVPDAFANDLTGIYATNPQYGADLIAIMRLYNLYRFDATAAQPQHSADRAHAASRGGGTSRTPGSADIPGSASPLANASGSAPSAGGAAIPGTSVIPGKVARADATAAHQNARAAAVPWVGSGWVPAATRAPRSAARGAASIPGLMTPASPQYQTQLPATVATAYFASAKAPVARAEPLYRDVAARTGLPWEMLAACDWMQCQSDPRYSPVRGEKLGTLNPDGTAYLTKSEALAQCAVDLIELSTAVYGLDLTAPRILSVRSLADAFAAFRWGAILRRHGISAMEFPYSVAGLTVQHMKMHWPAVGDPDAPDKPGGRFRLAFGAVPVVLSLHYPATV
jgi:flagellum-specific peptidoglycan hydrolase FlgJ